MRLVGNQGPGQRCTRTFWKWQSGCGWPHRRRHCAGLSAWRHAWFEFRGSRSKEVGLKPALRPCSGTAASSNTKCQLKPPACVVWLLCQAACFSLSEKQKWSTIMRRKASIQALATGCVHSCTLLHCYMIKCVWARLLLISERQPARGSNWG